MKSWVCAAPLTLFVAAPAFADAGALRDGIVLFEAGEAADAAAILKAVANDSDETVPHRARATLYLALCQTALGDTEGAALSFRVAFQLDGSLALPSSAPPGALALANAARERLGQPDLAASSPVPIPPPEAPLAPPPPPIAEGPAPPAPPTAAASAPAPAPATASSGLFIGLDLLDIGFINSSQASPTPELEVGYGTDAFHFSGLFGLMLGDQLAYSGKARATILGTSADPVGWNWTFDLGLIDLTGPQASVYFELSTSPLNITWQVATHLILEARLIGVGYYWSLDGNGLSTWSLEGGLGARWML